MKENYDLIFEDAEKFKDYFLNDEDHSIKYFPNFNSINIIVGANNCGKSRFMRELMSLNSYVAINDLLLLKKHIDEYNSHVEMFNIDKIQPFLDNHTKRVYGGSMWDQKADRLQRNKPIKLNGNDFRNIISGIKANKKRFDEMKGYSDMQDDFLKDYSKIEETYRREFNPKKYYIPTLRTAHSLFNFDLNLKKYSKIEDDAYLHTYLKNYKISNSVEIFTGLHLYREILNARNSKRETRNKFEKFQDFVGENFFDGKKIDIVAEFKKEYNLDGKNDNEIISVDIEGEIESRDLCDLGDGIQALIILMYKIFMVEDNSFIFIDEPELNLHPGMQRLFLEQITNNKDLKKKNLTYVITTHSNHFLDLTIEKENVSIYSFAQKKSDVGETQFVIKNVNRGNNCLLKELGVNNSSVFMANCSIWLEGISDRNYIKAFLKSYCDYNKKSYPKEDIDFAFFEYAGSNIDHYIFDNKVEKEDADIVLEDIRALAISNRIFLLADSDASKQNSKKGIRLKKLEDAASDNFIPRVVWNIREVENLLTNEMWKEILIDLCNKTLVKSYKTDILLKIDKALSEVKYSDFAKKYVGEFLEQIRNKMGKISSVFILNQSAYEVKPDGSFGTITNKRELSELIFNKNFCWEILSKNEEIEKLTKEIYKFITQK